MIKNNFKIENIPAILWGDKSDKLFVVVHGNMSNKADDSIIVFAEEATAVGYQVLRGDKSIASFKKDCPVDMVSKALKIRKEGSDYILT
ncbi:hypothetical protein ACBQ08_28375, partial [Aneurinibacillus aneurinilyticus]